MLVFGIVGFAACSVFRGLGNGRAINVELFFECPQAPHPKP